MYQTAAPRTYRARPRKKASKKRKQGLPLSMFLLSVVAFSMAFQLTPDNSAARLPEEDNAIVLPVTVPVMDAEEPALPDSSGVEPAIPTGKPAADDGRLMLVNPWNALPEDYSLTLQWLPDGHAVDERCYTDLQAMLTACRSEGLSPLICSAYRSQEDQEALFQNKVDRLIAQDYSSRDAAAEAAKAVAFPGTSEHQLGLAVDIVDINNQLLDESQEDTAVQKWLMEHCWEYGFILRYPNGTSEITGIIYEPWHYRYVGKEAAREIREQGVCLEEYLAQ